MYKLVLKLYLQLLLIIVLIVPTIIYISDPYMIFHNKWFKKEQIHSNMRIQNYGLIKFGNFDSIIMGTSMLENLSANEASQKLNLNFANLSISGGSFYEKFKILNLAFKQKNIKHVIYSLDYKFSKANETNNTFYPSLYDEDIASKFQVYATSNALMCIFLNLDCDRITYNLDRPNAWYNKENHKRRFGGFENWLKHHKTDNQVQGAFTELLKTKINHSNEYKDYKEVIDNEILPILNFTKTQYSIIIPPYSILWWAKRKKDLDNYLNVYSYLIKKTEMMTHVKIYWFYDEDFIDNIAEYKDLTHYHYKHNSEQIDAIKNSTNIIDSKNYINKFNDFKRRIYQFDFEKYLNKIPKEYAEVPFI